MDTIIDMQKGFEFWGKKDRTYLIWVYWTAVAVSYLYALWLYYRFNIPGAFVLAGVMPYLFAKVYRVVRKPERGVIESIKKIDPVFYESIAKEISQLEQIKKAPHDPRLWRKHFCLRVWMSNASDVDPKILVYRNNLRRFDLNVAYGFAVWFLTLFIFPFIAWAFHL